MKHVRQITLLALLLCLIVRPSKGCGPGDPEAVFIRLAGPDEPYARYAAGHLGVMLPTYRVRHLVVAFDYLNGRPLTRDEQTQAAAADGEIDWESAYTYVAPATAEVASARAASGIERWVAAHEPAVSGAYTAPQTDRKLPGDSYESFANCLDDAFANATTTLAARAKAYGRSSAEVIDWIHAQDAVFTNCADKGTAPNPAPANAPLWLKQDRAYQLAAANFYATNYPAALTGFRAIAADHASPWSALAPYLIARTLVRQTTVAPAPPYNDPLKLTADQQRVHAGLSAALQQLDAILHDPAQKAYYPATTDLRDLVAARVEPEVQAQVLAHRLTDAPHGFDLGHNLIDLTFIVNHHPADAKPILSNNPASLLAFIQTIATPTDLPAASRYGSAPPETPDAIKLRLANQHNAAQTAFTQWQISKKPAWMIAALTLAQPSDSFVTQLIAAARSLAPDSPAYLTATYNRLRLESATAAVRIETAKLLPLLEKSEPRSTINLYTSLLRQTSPTLADYLRTLPLIPASSNFDGAVGAASGIPTPEICGKKLEADKTPLFDEDAATILNQRMPLRLLRDAVLSESLPLNLRFQLANATLTRAVLLDQPAVVAAVTPFLSGCQVALKPWLDHYNAATTPDQRHLQGLFLLMRFASAEPSVHAGNQRPVGFATYSSFRGNWWPGNEQYFDTPAPPPTASGAPVKPSNYVMVAGLQLRNVLPESPDFKPALFSVPIVPPKLLPSPPFISPANTAEVAPEILALQHIPGAGDYFALQALDWIKLHPTDSNNAELLGFAIRVLRNSLRSANASELNHQLFNVIHRRYPASTWAKRYTTWE